MPRQQEKNWFPLEDPGCELPCGGQVGRQLPTRKPQLLLCHCPPGAPEQAAVALFPPSCPILVIILPGTVAMLFPFCSELGLPDSTEREKEKESKKAIPPEKQTGSELFSSALGHLQTPHLGVSTE